MRILLTCQNLVERAGSKQYCHALASAWADQHEVWVVAFGKHDGPMGQDMMALRIHSVLHIDQLEPLMVPDLDQPFFDLGIVSPNVCFGRVRKLCRRVVNVSHGIVDLEAPVAGADHYVYISEEAERHWRHARNLMGDGWKDSVIRNAIDLSRYYPVEPPRKRVECIAHFSNYDELPGLAEVCLERGIRFHRIKHKPYPVVLEQLNDADLVFAVGRSALEAMACGREVAFCDNRSYYGVDGAALADGLASEVYRQARFNNCSGRWAGHQWGPHSYIKCAIDLYSEDAAWSNRELVAGSHDHRRIAEKILRTVGLQGMAEAA